MRGAAPRSLEQTSAVTVHIPVFASWGDTRCDASGNVYFQVFTGSDDGTIWLSAYYAPRAAEQLRGKQYVAISDASGRLIKQLPSYLPDKHQGQTGAKTLEGNAALGKDGNLYLLGPEKIIVMSESGEVLRTIKFEKTNPQQIAMRVDVSDGLVAITLTTVDKNTPHDEYLVLDSLTGNPFGLYEVDPTAPSKSMLCFNRQDGFTFLGGDKASVKFLHYALR